MANTWDEIAHTALENNTSQPIQADATNVVKYGAPSVAVVTTILTAILGASWKVDPSQPAVLFSTAIIIAAIVTGIYIAFAIDVRTRGAVTIARYEAIAKLTTATDPTANGATPAVHATLAATRAQLDVATKRVTKVSTDLAQATQQRDQALGQLEDTRSQLADAKQQLSDLAAHATTTNE
jgi:hypothetical protein